MSISIGPRQSFSLKSVTVVSVSPSLNQVLIKWFCFKCLSFCISSLYNRGFDLQMTKTLILTRILLGYWNKKFIFSEFLLSSTKLVMIAYSVDCFHTQSLSINASSCNDGIYIYNMSGAHSSLASLQVSNTLVCVCVYECVFLQGMAGELEEGMLFYPLLHSSSSIQEQQIKMLC